MDSQCPFSGRAVTEGKRQEEERRGGVREVGGARGRSGNGRQGSGKAGGARRELIL